MFRLNTLPSLVKQVVTYSLLILAVFMVIFPFAHTVLTSIKLAPDMFVEYTGVQQLLPSRYTLEWYQEIFEYKPIIPQMLNSLIVATSTMFLNLLIGSLGAYSLSRFNYRGKNFLSLTVLFVYMFPPILLFIPIYLTIYGLGLINTYLSLILTHTILTLPFSLWLLKTYFDTIPPDMEEAAMVDGANRLGALIRILLPIAFPGLVAAAIFAFISSWNEYLFASILINRTEMKTLPPRIAEFIGGLEAEIEWGSLMASATIAAIPSIVLFLIFQKWFTQGLAAGAVKG